MQEKLKTLQIIHVAVVLGLAGAYIFVGGMPALTLPEIDSESMVYLVLPIIAVGLSLFLFRKSLRGIDRKKTPEENMAVYQTACITRWAMIEGGAFIILFLAPAFLLLGWLLVVYLILIRPTKSTLEEHLGSDAFRRRNSR